MKPTMTQLRLGVSTVQLMAEGDIQDYLHELSSFVGVDILFGGPPCQGFSVAGKMNPKDARSQLVWCFMDAVGIVKPRVFVLGNVAALAKLKRWENVREGICQRGRSLGYDVTYAVHRVVDYSVPENRLRVLFLGVRLDIGRAKAFSARLAEKRQAPPSARETLLAASMYGSSDNPATCTAGIFLARHPVLRSTPYAGMLVNGGGRPINLDGLAPTLPASMGGNRTPIVDDAALQDDTKENWFSWYHRELMAGHIQPSEVILPSSVRRLTIKESTAIQTFPRDYHFTGCRTKQYRQIGNAVPCRFARAVAETIRETYFPC